MGNKIKTITHRIFGIILTILSVYLVYLSFLLCHEMSMDISNKDFGMFLLHILCLTFSSIYALISGLFGIGMVVYKIKEKEKE